MKALTTKQRLTFAEEVINYVKIFTRLTYRKHNVVKKRNCVMIKKNKEQKNV